jgi:L-threonylcarbamoyladenylate synthase
MPREASLQAALRELDAGRLVVIPTDTVYGLAARPDDPAAVEAVFAAKGRPVDKPLPILGASPADLEAVATLGDAGRRVAHRWPGPLTLVVPRARGFDHDLGGRGSQGVAIRVPACEIALELLRSSGPLAVTSANLSGRPPATTVTQARDALGHLVQVFVDGGPRSGRPSTVVSLLAGPELLRAGPIPFEQLLQELGEGSLG